MNKKFLTTALLIATFASCSSNVDNAIKGLQGTIKVNNNGAVEKGVCYLWETLTGHKLGASLEELITDKEVDIKLLIIMLQNYVEKAHKLGATREGAIENLLVEAGYDNKLDGKMRISKITKEEVKKRLNNLEKMKRAYLKNYGK